MKKIAILSIMALMLAMPMQSQITSGGFPTSERKVVFKGFPDKDPSDVLGVPIVENLLLLLGMGAAYATRTFVKKRKNNKEN